MKSMVDILLDWEVADGKGRDAMHQLVQVVGTIKCAKVEVDKKRISKDEAYSRILKAVGIK